VNKYNKFLIVLTIIIFNSANIFAQEDNENVVFKHFRGAFTIGHGYIPQAESNGPDFLIIPTIGLDFQYWFNSKWGIAIKSDIEITNYIVKKNVNEGNIVIRENPFIIALPVLIRPWENGLSFLIGPGIEIEKVENFSILRLGITYEFEVGKEWDFSPEILYDLKDKNISAFTIAIGIGKRF
jgi:hypothetical protein